MNNNLYLRSPDERNGFTLIELLVVVTIIALLVSILLPSLSEAKDLAKGAVCLSNVKQIGLSIFIYANNYNGEIPRKMYWPSDPTIYEPRAVWDWTPDACQLGLLPQLQYLPQQSLEYGFRTALSPLFICPGRYNLEFPKTGDYSNCIHYLYPAYRFTSTKLGNIPPGACLVTEFPYEDVTVLPVGAKYHPAGSTVLYGDGHVESRPGWMAYPWDWSLFDE